MELVVGDILQFGAVVLGDDELCLIGISMGVVQAVICLAKSFIPRVRDSEG